MTPVVTSTAMVATIMAGTMVAAARKVVSNVEVARVAKKWRASRWSPGMLVRARKRNSRMQPRGFWQMVWVQLH